MSEVESSDNNKIFSNIHHSLVDMDDTGGQNLLPDGKTEDDHYSSKSRKQKRHIHRGKKKSHRRRKSKKKFHTSTEISYSFPSLNDTYERLRKIDVIVNNTETTKTSGTFESSTVHETDNEELNEEFGTSESLQLPHETMDEDLDEASGTYGSSTLKHHKTNQEDSDKVSTSSKSSTLQHQTSSKNSKSSPNIFEVELNDIIENDKELDESFSIIEETTTLTSHVPNKSEGTSATTEFNIPSMDNAPSSSEDFSLGDEKTVHSSDYQIDIMKQLVTLTEYPPTKQKKFKDQAVKRSEEHIYPLNSKNRKMTNVNNEKPHPVHSTKVEYEEVDSTEPVSSFDNSDYGTDDDEDYIDIQLPFEKPHRIYTERFVEKREPATQPDQNNQRLLSKMKFDRRFNRRRLFATSTAFWRGFKWPEFEESFDSIIRDSDKLLQKDVTSTKPSTKEDFVWTAMFTTPAAETENKAPYDKMEENDENMIESANFYSELSESSTFEESESWKQAETSHPVTVNVPEMVSTSHSKTPQFPEHELSENKGETKMKIEVGTVVADYSNQTKSLLSFSWPDQIHYTTASPVETTSAAKHGNASEESTTEGYTSSKLSTNTIEALNQSSYKTINNSVTERPRTRMQKVKEKAKFWKNFIWPDHQIFTTPKIIESSEVVNTTRMNEGVVESEMKTTSQKITTTEKEERSTKIIEGTNYSPRRSSSSYHTEKLEHEGLVSSTEEHNIGTSKSTSMNRENFKKTFLFHLRGKSNNTSGSGSERKHFELPFQWPSEEVFENETSEKPLSVSSSEEGKKEESLSELTNFKWPEQEKFDFASANTPLTETATFELPNIRTLSTTSSYTSSKPGKSPWGKFQWPEHNLFSYHHIDTEKQKETSSSTTEKLEAEEWGFSLDQDVKDLLEESERGTLRLQKGTPYPSKLTSSPTKATTRGERIELVDDMADFKNVSGKFEEIITKGPMKVSVKHKVNAQVIESEDDEGLWKFRVLEPGEVIKHYKNTIKPFFKSPTIYSFKPIGTPFDEWLQFNEDLQERTVTEPTVSEKTKSTFFIWKTEPITSTESEFVEDIFEEYSTLTPLESTSETTEFFNAETTSESSTSEEYTIPEIITTEKPIFSSEIYDVLSRTEGAALKFNVSSFIRNFMKKFTDKMKNTAVKSIKMPTISAEADKENLGSTSSLIVNITPLTIGKIIEGDKLGSTRSIIENIVPLSISARVEEENLGSTQSSFENIVPLTISESIEEEKLSSIQSIVENIIPSTIAEIIEEQKLGSTRSIIENIVPLSISGRVEEGILGSTQSTLQTFVPLSISGKVEEERLGSTEVINENILPSTISEKVEEENVSSSQAITEYIAPSKISERVGEEKLGSTEAINENILPSTISEKVEEEKVGSSQAITEYSVPSKISERAGEEKLSSTEAINENILPTTVSEKVEEEKVGSSQAITEYIVPPIISERVGEEKLGSTKVIIENILPSTTSAKVEEENLGRIQTIMENVVTSKYADQEIEDRSGSLSSIWQTRIETTPMTPAGAHSQISEEFTESGIIHETRQPEIQKPQDVLILDQISKKIEPEDLSVERTSSTWLFETNYPEYSSRQSDENLMNEMEKLEEYDVNGKFLPEKIYQTTEESVSLAEAQSALVEGKRRSQKPLILLESELGTTFNYFQELKGFEKQFRPAGITTIFYGENDHIKSKIAEEVTEVGEMLTNEPESEVLEGLLTEINREPYSETLKLTGSEFKDKWKYDMNLPRSSEGISEGRYPTELIRTTAEQEYIHPKMVHFPYQASTSHREQFENELDRDIVHITQKKIEEDTQVKEEYENNMNHLPENVLKETSTICQICEEKSSYEGQIGEISKGPKSTSRRYKLIPVNYNQEGIEINRPVPTKKGDVFIFNQKSATVSPSSTFTEFKVPSIQEQGTTKNVQKVTLEKVHAEADKTEMTSLREYLTVSSTLTEEVSEIIGREGDKFLTKHGKEGEFLDTVNFETNTEPVSIESISFNKEENETSEYYSTNKTESQEDVKRTNVGNTLSTSEYFGQGIVGENLSTYAEDVFVLETVSVREENLPITQTTSESVLLENKEVSEKSVISQPETLGKKTTNLEFKHPFAFEYYGQTMGERFHSTKPKGNQFTTKELNVVEHSLTPSIAMMSRSKTTEMKGEKKYKTRTSKVTHVEHVQSRLMPMGTTERKEEYENNMLHLPKNKQKETSTLCEICDSEAEYEVGKDVSTSNPKVHKSTRTHGTINTEFEISEPTSGPYHFKGIKTGTPLPTESHTIPLFKMYSTSFSELQKLNTASKGGYHSQSLITTARAGTVPIETTLNVPQEISTTTESNTLPKEFITTVEGNMFLMETSIEASQKYFETANENTTPLKTYPSAEVSQTFITTAEKNTISTGAFSLAEENVATSETFVHGTKPKEGVTAPEEIFLETFSTEKALSKLFTTSEKNAAIFVNEYSQKEFVTTAPINASSMETFTSEKSLKELITKAEENAVSLEIFSNEEKLQELIATNVENTPSLETLLRQKTLQELITTPEETTGSFMNEYSLEELVNTTDINTALADRISSEKNTKELITIQLENTASTELSPEEKSAQELLITKETNIALLDLFPKETSSQEFVTKPVENTASSVNKYSFEEFIHATEINTASVETTSSEKNTQRLTTIRKENTAPEEISPHVESSKETITMREENTAHLGTYSKETISEEFFTPAETNVASILDEFSLEELVNTAEMTTAQEVPTLENENIASVEVFPHGTNLQEGMTTKEEDAVSLETFSKAKVSQEFITTSKENTAFMNKYIFKELVNTAEMNTATWLSLPSENNTQELITLQNEKIASVGIFPHEKEQITTKGGSTAYSEISLTEKISQEFITTPQENTEFVVDKYSLEQFINTAEMYTASLESISSGNNTPELISMEKKKTVSTEIPPYEKSVPESTTSIESHTLSSEIFSGEKFLNELITTSEVNTTSLMNEYGLEEIGNTAEIDIAPVELVSRKKITQELITRGTENTTPTEVFLHEKNLHEFITSKEGGTVSSETFSGEKLVQEFITTPEERITTLVSGYGIKEIVNAAETITAPVESISREKITQELITKGKEKATTTGVFPHEKNLHEIITSIKSATVSSETFSREKLLQEFVTTPKERITTLVSEYGLKEIVNAAETNPAPVESISTEKITQELITKGKEKATTTGVFPHEKNFHEFITSIESGTVSSETFSREKLLQESITTPEERITTLVSEYGLKEIVNAAETNTAPVESISREKITQELISKGKEKATTTGVFPHEKNFHEIITSIESGTVSSETFSREKLLQESITTPEERITTLVSEHGLKEIVNAAETNPAPVESISREKITQELISKGKEKATTTGVFPHEKNFHEIITSIEGGTVSSETFSGVKLHQESITTPEERITSLVSEYGLKAIVNAAEAITASVESISREKTTQELITKGKENTTPTRLFAHEKELHEFITSKEGGTVSSITLSGEKLLQESNTTPEERIPSLANDYGLKEIVNTAQIITGPVASISRGKITHELTKGMENSTPTGIFLHEKNLHELITSKEESTVFSETFSGEKLLKESIEKNTTPKERITSPVNEYGLEEIVTTAEINTAPVELISRGKITQELITKGKENTTPTGIFPHEEVHEFITSKEKSTVVSSETFSGQKLLQEFITIPEERITSPVNGDGLQEIVYTTETNTAPVKLFSREKITEELLTKGKKNTIPTGIFSPEEELHEFNTSNKESTVVSSGTISGQKLLQEFITTPEGRITSPVNEYGFQETVYTAEINTNPVELISREKITQELITKIKETTTPTGLFPREKELHEFINSKGESTVVSSVPIPGQKLLQDFITTSEEKVTSFINEFSPKDFVNTAEINTTSMVSVSKENKIEELITSQKETSTSLEIFPREKTLHEFITSERENTPFAENFSNEKILQEFSTTSEKNMTFEYGPQNVLTTAEMKTASMGTFPNEKSLQGPVTTTGLNISFVNEFSIQNFTEKINITPHTSTVAEKIFSHAKELEFIITTERNIASIEGLSKENVPQKITTTAKSITASIEPFFNGDITAVRTSNEETPQEFNFSSRMKPVFTEKFSSEKTNTETIREEPYETEIVGQSEKPAFERVTERIFTSPTPNLITTEKNMISKPKNLNRISDDDIGSEIFTKNLNENKMFFTSLSKKSTTENEGKTSLKSNLVRKEWPNEMEDDFEMLHLPHVDRYETSTICEICSESEDIQMTTLRELQSEDSSSIKSITERVSVRTNKEVYEEKMSTRQIEHDEEYEGNMLNLPRKEEEETSTLCEICDEETQYEGLEHISSKKAEFRVEIATPIIGRPEISESSLSPYRFTGIEINRPIPTQNLNIVPFKMYSSTGKELSNANTPKIKEITASTEASSEEKAIPLSINEELFETEHEGQSKKPAYTIPEDINIKPVILSTVNEEEIVTQFHSKKKLGTISDEYIGSSVTESLNIYSPVNTSEQKERDDDYEILHLPHMNQHETSTICEICEEVENIETSKPQLFTFRNPYVSTEIASNHVEEEKASSKNFDYVEESNMLKLPESGKDETSTLCEICDEEAGTYVSAMKTVLFENLDTSKYEFITVEQEAITNTDGAGRIIINRPIPTQNVNILPFNVHSTMFNAFTNSEDEFLFQNFLKPSTELHNLIQPLENVVSESVSEVSQETEIMDQSEQSYTGLPLLSPGVLDQLESSEIPQSSSPNELISPFYIKEIDSNLNLYTQASSEELKEEFTEDLLTKVFDETEFSKMSLLSSLSEFTPLIEIEGETETIFESAKSEEMTLEADDEILHADESVYYSKQPYDGVTLLPSDLTEDLNVHAQASSEETKNEITEDLLTKVLDKNGFSRISSPNEFAPPFEVEGEAETIVHNVKSEKVTLEADDEILHADESLYYSKQPYDGVTLLPSELTEDLNVHAQASSEETKNEITEDLLTKVLDENEFSRISFPNEFTPLFEVEEEAETIYHNAKPEEVTLESVDEILHADETVDHSRKPYNEGTILPSDLREDLNADTQASSEELKAESTEDLLTKVLDETEFLEISLPSSLDEFTTQFEVREAEKMFRNAKPEDSASKSVDEILHESEIVYISKPYSEITILPVDLLEIGSDSNLYTQSSTEEVKVEFTEDLLTKVLDENEIPQIKLSPSIDEVAAQLQVEETEKMIQATSKNPFLNESLQDLQLDQYKTSTIPHYDHILETQTLSTTEKVLESSTQSAELTISQKLDQHEYREEVHLGIEQIEYRKTESITTSKLDTEENLPNTSSHHTKKPEMHQPITYKFEGIKIERPVPTENTNVFLFKMLPTTEPRLCKFGEEEFPYEKNISSTHKGSLHLESFSVESPTSEMKETLETGQINETGTGYEIQNESLTITEQTSDIFRAISTENTPIYSEGYVLPTTELKISSEINKTNFALVNVEHVMKQQSSTLFFLKTSENMPEVKGHTISDYESSRLELTSGTLPLKEEEAMAATEKKVSKKLETYGTMMSSILAHHTSEMTKHNKHVNEENIKEEFRVTQEAYTPSFLSEAVEFEKDISSHNAQSSEISIQSTLGVNGTIENEIEKQFVEENFPSSTMHAEEKSTEVVSSRDELLIPKELNEKLESLGGVVSEIFTSTLPPVHNLMTVEREFQTINMETDILENELKELNVDFSEMLATTMPSDIMLQRLEEIMEPSGSHHLGTKTEPMIHSSQYISSNSELVSASEESIKNTVPEISKTKSIQTFNPVENKALSEAITEWNDAMVDKLLVPLSPTENLTAAEESEMKNYSVEINLPTTISATGVTVMEHEFLSAPTNISGEMYKPDVISSKEEELLLTTFPEEISEAKFLAIPTESPSSKTSKEGMFEQYEWDKKGSPSESQLLMETEGQLERETSAKYTISTETPIVEHEIFSQSPNTLEESYTSSAIISEEEILYTPYKTQLNIEENFLATLHEEGNVKVSALKEESKEYSSEEELLGKPFTNIMEHEISWPSSNTLEGSHYAHTSSLWQKETETEYSTESELKKSSLASLIDEGHAEDSTKTTIKEENMKYFSEEVTERTITNIIDHEIFPTLSSTLEVFYHPATGSSQQKESEPEYSTESEERFLATLMEGGHAKVPTKTTRKEEGMKHFSEEVTERTFTNIIDHEISQTPSSTLEIFYHPVTGSSQKKESETEYSTESEESFLATLIEGGHAKVPTKTTKKEEGMKHFSEGGGTERTITNIMDHEVSPTPLSTLDVLLHPITGSSSQKESEIEYLTKLNSEEIMLGTLVENETSSLLTNRTTEGYRTQEMKGFSVSQLETEEKSEAKQSPEEYISSIESTIIQHSEAVEDHLSHYSSSSFTEPEAAKTEYSTELHSDEIMLATLVENETTEITMGKTGGELDFLTNLEETTTVGLYNIITSEKLPAENISETSSEEVFLNTLFEEEKVNISVGNQVFPVETTVKHGGETSTSSSTLEGSYNHNAFSTEHGGVQTENFTKMNSEEAFLATLVESEVTRTLPENTSEKPDWQRKDTTFKSPGVEKISGIPLLTTLLLSLVASSTQHPETNQMSGHYKINAQDNQTFPKCLVVFFTGENASNPMISLNGTKWIPSLEPFNAEESTNPSNESMSQISQLAENTSHEANSVTTELSEDETSEETETTSTVEVTTEEIIDTSNFVQGECTEADFENNNNCFCMLDLTIDHVAGEFQASNSSNLNKVECSTFLKVNTGLIIKDEKTPAKRKKRSYLYLKYHNRKKREIVEYNELDEVLANELVPSNSGGAIYSAVGASVSIPCVYKNEVVEREHFTRYVWTFSENKVVQLSDRVRETTDGVLKISDVAVKDGGNYTCSVNRPFGTTDAEHKRFQHELMIVDRPIFKIQTTIMYNTEETCSLKHGDIIHNHLPKLLEELLCGLHKRVCKVEMERPNCVSMEDNTYLSFKYVVALDALPSLIPSLTYEKCDFDCQMKIYGSLISLLIKNVETINFLNIVSEMKTSNHTFKPREIKFPTDRKTVEDTTLFPMLLIGCPPGFGIQQKNNKICVACPRDYYSADNSSSCVPCPFIHFQPNLGSTDCLECRTPFEDKSCVGMVLANRSFLIIYIGSSVAIIFLILLCVFCAQSVGTPAKKKKNTQTPKRRRIGRRDIEDPAEKTLLLKDTASRKVVKGPKVPPPDFY